MKTLQLACALLLAGATPSLAGEWEVLGTKVVGVGVDRDVIPVGASEGRFVAVKLTVADRGINLHDFKIHFANGDVKDVAVKKIIRKGAGTRVIDLPGNKRVIKKVTLLYNAVGRRRNPRRPKVTIHGKRGAGVVVAPKPKPVVVKPKIEWSKLGERKVGFLVDKDTIKVTAANGLFHKIRLKVSDSPIRFRDLKIHFGNNTVLDVPVKKHFKPGDKTRIIDLPGKGRVIKKVVMWYDTKGFRGRATVALWGGKRADAAEVEPKPVVKPIPTPAAGKWHNLGNKKVAHRTEKDVIPVTATEGRFRALKLKVTQRGIHLVRVKVVLGNGESHAKTFNTKIPAGGETPAFNLPGSKRVVKAVHLWYRTKGKPRGPRAWVTLLGKK